MSGLDCITLSWTELLEAKALGLFQGCNVYPIYISHLMGCEFSPAMLSKSFTISSLSSCVKLGYNTHNFILRRLSLPQYEFNERIVAAGMTHAPAPTPILDINPKKQNGASMKSDSTLAKNMPAENRVNL